MPKVEEGQRCSSFAFMFLTQGNITLESWRMHSLSVSTDRSRLMYFVQKLAVALNLFVYEQGLDMQYTSNRSLVIEVNTRPRFR